MTLCAAWLVTASASGVFELHLGASSGFILVKQQQQQHARVSEGRKHFCQQHW
jgi:hypothetical protein